MTETAPNISAVLAIWTDVTPEAEADFNEWYWREHLPERLAVPGFRHGRRYGTAAGAPAYFAYYELASIETARSPAYIERLENPTEWTRRIMPCFRNTVRAVCNVRTCIGRGTGGVARTVRFSPAEDWRGELGDWIGHDLLPALHRCSGIVRVQHWVAETVAKRATAEAALRGGPDDVADWTLVIEAEALDDIAAALDRTDIAARLLAPSTIPGTIAGTYRFLYGLSAGDRDLEASAAEAHADRPTDRRDD